MILTVKPASVLKGKVQLPTSKSYTIRAFMIAACGGNSIIINPSNCDDAKISIHAARSLGAEVRQLTAARWSVSAGIKRPRSTKINVKESGTVLRLLLPLLALHNRRVLVVGEGTLRGRPNLFLTRTLRKMGSDIQGKGKDESIPIYIKGGALKGGRVVIDGSRSSQFISALLMTCPQLLEDTVLKIKGKRAVSTDYITMTCRILKKGRVNIQQRGLKEYRIKGRQKFKGLNKFTVPSDYGLAAFLMAAAVLTESNVTLTGHLKNDLVQADGHILSLLRRMGGCFKKTSKDIKIQGPCLLRGGNFSLKNCPDLVPIVSILALFAKGKTRLYDIGHVRAKESDRISDLRRELQKIGAKVTEKRDSITIEPKKNYKQGCLLNPHNDHRLAMSFSVLGLKLGVRVKDIECTRKSYPDFVRDFQSIGALVRKSS